MSISNDSNYNSYLRSKINQRHTYRVSFRSIIALTILHGDLLQPLANVVSWKQFLWGSPELSITNHRITRRKRKLRADCIHGYIRSRFSFTTRSTGPPPLVRVQRVVSVSTEEIN